MTRNDTTAADDDAQREYQVTDHTTVRGVDVYVKNRMTAYEMDRFKERADRFLDAVENAQSGLSSYPVDHLIAYGNARRIGAQMEPGHDPLGNGIIVSNIDGFSAEAVKPAHSSPDSVFIRFQEDED